MNKVLINFKTKDKTRLKFKEIVQFRLLTDMTSVLDLFVEDFVKKWETQEGKEQILRKYFKANK